MERETRFRLSQVAADQQIYQIKDLVEKTGLQPSTISGIWKNNTKRLDLKTLDRLSQALGCSSLELLEQVEVKSTPKKRKG